MNPDEFIKLAEAYGANIKHWPRLCQKQAMEVFSLNLPEVNYALEQARLIDEILHSNTIAPVERSIFDNIVAKAPRVKESSWNKFNIKSWLCLVGTTLSGAVVGALFVSIWTFSTLPESIDGLTETSGSMAQYEDVGQEWS